MDNVVEISDNIAKLKQEVLYYRHLATISPVGIFYIKPGGFCSYVNPSCKKMLGLSKDKTLGYGWQQSIHPADRKQVFAEFNHLHKENKQIKLECRLLRPDQSIVWVYVEIVPKSNNLGRLEYYIGTATDITKLRIAEEQIREDKINLERASRLSIIGELTTGIAHQLNQPLTAIVHYTGGCIERLKQEETSPDIVKVIERIIEQAEQAGSILHGIKDFLVKGELQKKQVNINNIIKKILGLINREIIEARINVYTYFEQDLPNIQADSLHIEQALFNILLNAVEILKHHVVDEKRIEIETITIGNEMRIIVQDNGAGISNELMHKVFEPFYTTKKDSMGMGLGIAKKIVENHKGIIAVESKANFGATFIVTLPLV